MFDVRIGEILKTTLSALFLAMAKRRVLVTDPKFPENGKEQLQDFFSIQMGPSKNYGKRGIFPAKGKKACKVYSQLSFVHQIAYYWFVCLFVCLLSHASNFISPFNGLMCLQGMHKIMHCNITLDP